MLVEQRQAARRQRLYVNVDDRDQRLSWCDRLNCTEQQLREGVWAVGAVVEDLRRHLANYLCIDTIEQRRFWCRQLECTETQLFDAVFAAGLQIVDVRRYLLHGRPAVLRH